MTRRVPLLLTVMALILVMSAGVAVAAVIKGNDADNTLKGTPKADKIYGFGGNDTIKAGRGNDEAFGNTGNDSLVGGFGADFLRGNDGDDTIIGGPGGDTMQGVLGSDFIKAEGDSDTGVDNVNCGEDADNSDKDIARVDTNDAIDGVRADTLVSSAATSCEVIFVNGVRLPSVPQ